MKLSLNTRYQCINIFYFATMGSMIAFASNYLLDLGFTSTTIGMVMAVYSILSVFLQPALANFSDNHPNITLRQIICALLATMAGLSALLYLASLFLPGNFLILVLVVSVFCLMNSAMPLFNSLAFIFEKFGVKINYGVARGLGSAAYAVVSMLLGYVVEWLGSGILPLAYVLFGLVTYVFVNGFKMSRQTGRKQEKKTVEIKLNFFQFCARYRMLVILLAGFMLVYTCHAIINNFYFQVVTEAGGTSSSLGIAVFIAAMMELPCMFGFDWLNRKFGIKNLIRISMAFSILKHLITWLATNMLMIYLASFLQALAYAIYIPALVYLVNAVVLQSDQLMGQSVNTTFMTVGTVIGSLLGGLLIDSAGTRTTLLVGVILTIVGTLVVFWALNQIRLQRKDQWKTYL